MANRNQGQNEGAPRSGTSNRGFASMDAAQQREIARMGGEAVSGNREHMAQIGRKGGEASAESRASARSQRLNAGNDTSRSGSAPRDPGSRGYADDGGQNRAQGERARGGEVGVGNRGLNARARGDDEGGRSLGASGASGRNDDGRMLGVSNMDQAVERNLGGRDVDTGARNLGSRSRGDDQQGGNRGMSGRSRDADQDGNGASRGMSGRGRDADQDDNSASRGNRGNPVGSPRSNRDDD
jgi:hypothetical protein